MTPDPEAENENIRRKHGDDYEEREQTEDTEEVARPGENEDKRPRGLRGRDHERHPPSRTARRVR